MSNQILTPNPFTLQPPANALTLGYIEASPTTRLHIKPGGAVWCFDPDTQFEITETQSAGQDLTRVWGAVPVVVDPGTQWADPIIAMVSINRVVPSGAWGAAVAVIDHDLENDNLKLDGPAPTPTPPAPPLIDLSHFYLLDVA